MTTTPPGTGWRTDSVAGNGQRELQTPTCAWLGVAAAASYLRHDILHYRAVDVGQTEIAAAEAVGELFVVEAEEV